MNSIIIPLELNKFKELIKQCVEEVNAKYHSPNENEARLTQKEAAKYLHISEPTLIDWKKKGKIPFHQFPKTRRIYFLKSELRKVSSQNSHLLRPFTSNPK